MGTLGPWGPGPFGSRACADWQCEDGVWCKVVKSEVDEDHPLRVTKHVKLEIDEDGMTREVLEISCDEHQDDSEWQCIG